jgi:hypothetical protein
MNVAVAVIIFVLIVIGWWLRRWYLPDRSCWWCKGTGTRWGSSRGRMGRSGPCFFCGGSGKRERKARK